MAKLAQSLHIVKTNLSEVLPQAVIEDAVGKSNHQFRQRKLGPVQTVVLLILQVLAANASLAQVRAGNGRCFSVSALSQARLRLPLAILQRVLDWLIGQFDVSGPRVIVVDAFNNYLPDVPEFSSRFHRPAQQRRKGDYPQSRTLGVFDLATGLLIAQHEFASDQHESPQLQHILAAARPGDILIFDRGFVSFANLALLEKKQIAVIARLPKGLRARRKSNRLIRRRLGKHDHQVIWKKPRVAPRGYDAKTLGNWDDLPQSIALRQVQHHLKKSTGRCRQFTLITSLLDHEKYPKAKIADWYNRRWEIETDIRHLKQTLKLEFFRTKSQANHQRELLLRAIAYNLVRIVMIRGASIKECAANRISFSDACNWIKAPHSPQTLSKLLINPERKRSSRVRKVKYRGKNYATLTEHPTPQIKVA